MADPKLTRLLEDSGLNEKESEVYLALLELGQASILDIANHSKVKRSTVYEIIPSLQEKGLLKTTKKGKKTLFLAENPRTISKMILEREQRFKEALPELAAIYNSQENKPRIFFYEGREEVQNMYDDTLREGKPLFNFTSIINLYDYLDRAWVENYIQKRIEKGISTKIISLESPEVIEWKEKAKQELREIKLMPKADILFSGDLHIYGNKIIITTYKKNLLGVLIEDENISAMFRLMFTMLWNK